MPSTPRVLVFDTTPDTLDVLQAVLEPRGMLVSRTRTYRNCEPTHLSADVLVIDSDAYSSNARRLENVPCVILGSIAAGHAPDRSRTMPGDEPAARRYLPKPFQYAELVRAIESLIDQRAA